MSRVVVPDPVPIVPFPKMVARVVAVLKYQAILEADVLVPAEIANALAEIATHSLPATIVGTRPHLHAPQGPAALTLLQVAHFPRPLPDSREPFMSMKS